jgi:hypothetical protein
MSTDADLYLKTDLPLDQVAETMARPLPRLARAERHHAREP